MDPKLAALFTENEREGLKAAFELYDTDQSGMLDTIEIVAALQVGCRVGRVR